MGERKGKTTSEWKGSVVYEREGKEFSQGNVLIQKGENRSSLLFGK